jgi:hypothetical protein
MGDYNYFIPIPHYGAEMGNFDFFPYFLHLHKPPTILTKV